MQDIKQLNNKYYYIKNCKKKKKKKGKKDWYLCILDNIYTTIDIDRSLIKSADYNISQPPACVSHIQLVLWINWTMDFLFLF